ncbi:MAG: PorT family protein [Muribaculaceae bacterium]|nr:PorT family protein [Muribaculaceae bacterium]
MMRHCTIVVMLACLALWATAQTHYEGSISVGGKAGATLSRVQFNPSVPQKFLPGMMLGGTFRYIEERHFGLILELNVEQRGWKEFYEGTDFQYQRRFTYVQLPMFTHIFFGNDRIKGFFNAGPEVGYMIAHSTKSNFDYPNFANLEGFPTANRHNEQLNLDIHSKFDYGISAGLGMEVGVARRHSVTLEGRFYYGLRDVFSNHKKDPFSGSSGMSLMFTLGYNYQIR